jgi:hypothetical protein
VGKNERTVSGARSMIERLISPPLDQLASLRQPLNDGEQAVLQLLIDNLSLEWEIYIQPHMNGLCPDFVLMHPSRGIQIVEVKDWNIDAMPWEWRTDQKGYPALWRRNNQGKWFRAKDDPVSKLRLYEEELTNLYCPRLGISIGDRFKGAIPCLASCIAMPRLLRSKMERFLDPALRGSNNDPRNRRLYWPFISADTIAEGNIHEAVPASRPGRYVLMQEVYARDLRHWLTEPDLKAEQRKPLELDARQRELAETRTQTGYRRVRGAAGSGKSQVLAAKAAKLALEQSSVLVVTYNITLGNYLRDLIVRGGILYGSPGVVRDVTILNFHAWCKRVCLTSGNAGPYYECWNDSGGALNDALANLVGEILESQSPQEPRYDAVLVDEGQDFRLSWWDALRKACRVSGEMLLVADKTQNLYGTASAWTDLAMTGAGFRGGWTELAISYRLPPAYLPYVVDFATRFIPETERILPEPRQAELGLDVYMRWIQVPGSTSGICAEQIANAVTYLPDEGRHSVATFSDVIFMADNRESGLEVVRQVDAKGIRVNHTFDPNKNSKAERRRKMAFYLGSEKVKATTIHSFKGWESSVVVVQIEMIKNDRAGRLAAVYAALTRLRAAENGPALIVVICSEPGLREYGATWPDFSFVEV